MGAVYEAVNTWTSKRVALKLMIGADAKHSDFIARFQREAKAIGRIEHENIVGVIDLGVHDGNFFLVQEFLDGRDLRAELDERNILSPHDTRDILVPVMSGIAAAHAQGVVHRDIKPQNIFLLKTSKGTVVPKVIDFGIAKLVDQSDESVSLTRTGAAIGTPLYMSPEQARGDRTLDAQTDIWSVGIVMFECLTGECPFDGNNHNEVIAKILTMNAPPLYSLGDFSQSLSGVVAKALERVRDKRYRTMDEFREAVLSCPEFARESLVEITSTAHKMSILGEMADAATMSARDSNASVITQDAIRNQETRVGGLNAASSGAHPAHAIDTPMVVSADNKRVARDSGTLSSSTLDGRRASASANKLPVAAIVAAVALVGVVVAAAKLSSSSQPPTVVNTQQPVTQIVLDAPTAGPAVMGDFGMAISADPPHATIEMDGRSVGIGAYAARFVRDGVTHRIRVSCVGYLPQEISFTDAPPPGRISLVRAPGSANARTVSARTDAGAGASSSPRQTGHTSGPLIRGYE